MLPQGAKSVGSCSLEPCCLVLGGGRRILSLGSGWSQEKNVYLGLKKHGMLIIKVGVEVGEEWGSGEMQPNLAAASDFGMLLTVLIFISGLPPGWPSTCIGFPYLQIGHKTW